MTAMPEPALAMSEAVEVFVRGWSVNRSRTHPYVCDRIGPAWVMRDAPRSGSAPKYRREEWVAPVASAEEVHDLAREHTRGSYAICVVRAVAESDEPVRERYRGLGYRLGATEPLMAHPLRRIPRASAPLTVTRVKNQELAEQVAAARRTRPRPDLVHSDSPVRQYVALDGAEPVGWAESVTVRRDRDASDSDAWCENMFVVPQYRRRGIARALLSLMLRDDRRFGARASVLLASHTGAKLYPGVGYRQIGELLLFTPGKR